MNIVAGGASVLNRSKMLRPRPSFSNSAQKKTSSQMATSLKSSGTGSSGGNAEKFISQNDNFEHASFSFVADTGAFSALINNLPPTGLSYIIAVPALTVSYRGMGHLSFQEEISDSILKIKDLFRSRASDNKIEKSLIHSKTTPTDALDYVSNIKSLFHHYRTEGKPELSQRVITEASFPKIWSRLTGHQ